MASNRTSAAVEILLRAVHVREAENQTDGQLLEQFLARRDEAAFAVLVRRHGAMVLGVCQRVLGNVADAEDAFQAVFIVLMRKAASLTARPVLGAWLHGVARLTALKAKAAAARRRLNEQATPRLHPDDVRNDFLPFLDEALGRLPEKYRLPIVLCDLEGKTRREAADQLGWPDGTVAGRLARGRALLAKRLLRDVQNFSIVVPPALVGRAAHGVLPPRLVHSATQAAGLINAGRSVAPGVPSAHVVVLAKGVLQAMLVTKVKLIMTPLLVAAVCGIGLRTFGFAPLAALPAQAQEAKAAPAPRGTGDQKEGAVYEVEAVLLVVRTPGTDANSLDDWSATHAILLRSPVIVRGAIEARQLRSLKTFAGQDNLAQAIISSLTVRRDASATAPGDGKIIKLSFRGPHADDCEKVLSAVIDGYRDYIRRKYPSVGADELKALRERRDDIEKKLRQKEKAYQDFRLVAPLQLKSKSDLEDFWKKNDAHRKSIETTRAIYELFCQQLEEAAPMSRSAPPFEVRVMARPRLKTSAKPDKP